MTGKKTLAEYYRFLSQFHENEKLVAWLQRQRIVVWLTPVRRRRILVFGSVIAGIVGMFHRHAPWRDYAAPGMWLAPSIAVMILFAPVLLKTCPVGPPVPGIVTTNAWGVPAPL